MKSLSFAAGGLLVSALIAAGLAAGSPRGPHAERSGSVELRIEPASTWGMVGRFELTGAALAEPVPLDFAAETSSARVAVAPGAYLLTLRSGARVACDSGAEGDRENRWASPLSIWPQPLAVAPGELTTVRIALPAQAGDAACASGLEQAEQRRALLER